MLYFLDILKNINNNSRYAMKIKGDGLKMYFRYSFLCFVFLAIGCAQAPIPSSYNLTTQQKMQTSYHWNILADDTADQIKAGLTAAGIAQEAIYINNVGDSPFNDAFYNMLLTRFSNKGMNIMAQKSSARLYVNYETQVIYHKAAIKTPKYGELALLTGGIIAIREAFDQPWSVTGRIAAVGGALIALDILDSASPDSLALFRERKPNTEVIVTTSVLRGDAYVIRKTDCYYVNFDDSWHYEEAKPQKIQVTGR